MSSLPTAKRREVRCLSEAKGQQIILTSIYASLRDMGF